MTLYDEEIDVSQDLTIYDHMNNWKHKTIPGGTYQIRDLLEPVFLDGQLVYDVPDLEEIRRYSKEEFAKIWDEVLRFEFPQVYYVDVSSRLKDLKQSMLEGILHEK